MMASDCRPNGPAPDTLACAAWRAAWGSWGGGLTSRGARRLSHRRDSPDGADMIRVLLVDDHAVVRTGFRLLLQSRPEFSVIAEAESGEAACQLYLELTPDVVVMDLAM